MKRLCSLLLSTSLLLLFGACSSVSPSPTAPPSPSPTIEPTDEPTVEPTIEPTVEPTPEIDPTRPVVALTFDDGPNLTTTVAMLDKLEQYGVKASFFVIGNNINDETAKVMLRAYDMGCEINNHSKTHSQMGSWEAGTIRDEIEFTSEKVFEVIGEYPKFFRPPYINTNSTMYESIDLPFICGIMSNDWEGTTSAEARAESTLSQTTDGTIILLHDFSGNEQTVEALDLIIPALLEDGYQFVTVSQLFEIKGVTPTIHEGMYSQVGQ